MRGHRTSRRTPRSVTVVWHDRGAAFQPASAAETTDIATLNLNCLEVPGEHCERERLAAAWTRPQFKWANNLVSDTPVAFQRCIAPQCGATYSIQRGAGRLPTMR